MVEGTLLVLHTTTVDGKNVLVLYEQRCSVNASISMIPEPVEGTDRVRQACCCLFEGGVWHSEVGNSHEYVGVGSN